MSSFKKALQRQLDEQNRIMDTIGEQLDDLYQVRDYMLRRIAEHQLTPVQQKKLELYEFIYNQSLSTQWDEDELIDLVRNRANCSRPVAIQLIHESRELFTTVLSVNKQWEIKRQLMANERLLQKAETMGDFKAYAALERNRYKLLEMVQEVTRNEEFKGHTLQITADPEVIGVKPASKSEIRQLLKELKEKYDYEDADIIAEYGDD